MTLTRHVSHTRPALVVLLVVLSASLPSVILTYAVRDDLLHLSLARSTDWTIFFPQMRYVTSVLVAGLHRVWGGTVADLWLFRLLHAVLLSIFSLVALLIFRGRGLRQYEATALAILVAFGPGTLALLKYSSAYPAPLAALLSAFAYVATNRALMATSRRKLILFLSLAGLLFVLALSTYQPYAMLYFVFVAFELVRPPHGAGRTLRRVAVFIAVFFGASMAYFAMGKLISLSLSLEELARAGLTTRPHLSAVYFLVEPLRDALNQFVVVPHVPNIWDLEEAFISFQWRYVWPYLTAASVALFLAWGLTGVFRAGSSSTKAIALKLLLAVVIVGLAYTPSLVVERFRTSYREQAAVYGVLAVYLFFSLRHVLDRRISEWFRIVVFVWVLLAVGVSTHFGYHYSLRPRSEEWNYVKDIVEAGIEPGTERIVAIVASTEAEREKEVIRQRRERCFPFTKDFGRLTSLIANGATVQIQQAVREAEHSPSRMPVEELSWEEWVAEPRGGAGTLPVDMRVMYPCELSL